MSKKYLLELINMSEDELDVELMSVKTDDFRENLRIGLKDQDRDTRHACAEAVMSCDTAMGYGAVLKDEAHRACINTRNLKELG